MSELHPPLLNRMQSLRVFYGADGTAEFHRGCNKAVAQSSKLRSPRQRASKQAGRTGNPPWQESLEMRAGVMSHMKEAFRCAER